MPKDKFSFMSFEKSEKSEKATISSKISSAYGNVKSLLLGNDLTGRRQTCEENPFSSDAETTLTGFKKDQEDKDLKPRTVDLSRYSNRLAHRTEDYEVPNLILRRGQQFDVILGFPRDFIRDEHSIILTFVTGSRPSQSRGSVVPVKECQTLVDGEWGFQYSIVKDKSVTLRVCTGSDAIIGRYELFIDTAHVTSDGVDRWRHKHPDDIFILFNPWNKDDPVYMPDEAERKEYIQTETGRLWLGSVEKYFVRPWNFGQFEYVCLIAAISLLDRSELADRSRANPTLVTRAICKAMHHSDQESGVIQAGWSGMYDDAHPPHAWTGSPAILEEFLKSRKGVKFGQCWTMAAVATTILRTLGIPSRCVTCYRAVHDSDYASPVNTHWSQDLRPKTEMDDAIWNFHVWTEAWFRRSDLPSGYDGWQALDPTPMECSEGVLTCGPAPVKAILQGDLHVGFDTKFLFAELHGGRVHWQVDNDGNMEAFIGGREVGGSISTKAVGTISRQDLTNSYKYPSGSEEVKAVQARAVVQCNRRTPTLAIPRKMDVEFRLTGGMDKTGDLKVALVTRNAGPEGRILDVYMGVLSSFYTGVTSAELQKSVTSVVLEPLTDNSSILEMKCSEYVEQKFCDSHLSAYVMARVRETGQRFATVQTYCLDRPHLDIKTEGRAVKGQKFQVVVKIANTLAVPLTSGVLSVDGPGLSRVAGIQLKKPVNPGEEFRETVTLTSRRSGVKEVLAVFYSRQTCNVAAVAEIDVVSDEKSA